jgi:hypothetical protein
MIQSPLSSLRISQLMLRKSTVCSATSLAASRSYFTNTDKVKREDPYHHLGLQWGDGATTAEIQAAYRKRAAQLHPDVNKEDSPAVALRRFQDLQKAYQTLIKVHSHAGGLSQEKDDEWRFSIWRNGDRIAIDRNDVAGVQRKRPAPPADSSLARKNGALLGHPSGTGVRTVRGEYLGDGKPRSSSVGRGLNKWVKQKEFVPWDGKTAASAASAKSKRT